jgi:hypothetical protein
LNFLFSIRFANEFESDKLLQYDYGPFDQKVEDLESSDILMYCILGVRHR